MTHLQRYFLCIGAQKAGTTWLYQQLHRQAKIYLPPRKELHYFDSLYLPDYQERFRKRRLISHKNLLQQLDIQHTSTADYLNLQWSANYALQTELTDSWYKSLFPQTEQYIGEITPAYALLPQLAFQHIQTIAPEVKIIFILRDPVARSWSQIRFFSKFFANKDLTNLNAALEFSNSHECHARSSYNITINNLEAVFKPEQIMLFYYEDLFQDPKNYLAKICEFIGCEFDPQAAETDLNTKIFASDEIACPAKLHAHLQHKYAYLIPYLEQKLGYVPDAWKYGT